MSKNMVAPSPHLLRVSLGLIFFYFGFLKFFPDLSPAEMLASQTVMRLSGGSFDARTAMLWLALLECSIGIGFLLNAGLRIVSFLFFFHMIGTFMPLFVLPELAFRIGVAPTLEGQYILKNVVFVAAGWTVLLPHCLPAGTPILRILYSTDGAATKKHKIESKAATAA